MDTSSKLNSLARAAPDIFQLTCACCGLPIAYLQGDNLVVRSRHHGEPHINIIPLAALRAFLNAAAAPERHMPALYFSTPLE